VNDIRVRRLHNCARAHTTYRAFAACVYGDSSVVGGEGPFAVLGHPWPRTHRAVRLFEAQADADEARAKLDVNGCGEGCTGQPHTLERLHLTIWRRAPAGAGPQ